MRVRLYELRVLALLLLLLWVGAWLAILVAYHPGGPADLLVGLTAALPVIVAAAGVAWPPLARGDRASVAVGWLGLVAALLLVPSISDLFEAIQPGAAGQTLLPAPEVAYAGLLALFTTSLFSGLGLARRLLGESALRRRRLGLGLLLAAASTLVVGAAFGGAVLANEAVLRRSPPSSAVSAWGPTDPALVPPTCQATLEAGPGATLDLSASSSVEGHAYGQLALVGTREGDDITWQAVLRSGTQPARAGFTRVGQSAWQEVGDATWVPAPPGDAALAQPPDLDRALVATTLAARERVATEDVGIELVGGARARHCRTATTGPLVVAALPPVAWLVTQAVTDLSGTQAVAQELDAWRGEIDWWVFGDGQLGQVTLHLQGLKPPAWPPGVLGQLDVRLTALSRDTPHPISPPSP